MVLKINARKGIERAMKQEEVKAMCRGMRRFEKMAEEKRERARDETDTVKLFVVA